MFWYLVGQVSYFIILLFQKNSLPFLSIFSARWIFKKRSNTIKYSSDILAATRLLYKEETQAHSKFTSPRVFITTCSVGKGEEKRHELKVWGGVGQARKYMLLWGMYFCIRVGGSKMEQGVSWLQRRKAARACT